MQCEDSYEKYYYEGWKCLYLTYDSSTGTGGCAVTKNPTQMPFSREDRTAWITT